MSTASMRLVLLGTAGGPIWDAERSGIASAVVVGSNVYLVDAGSGACRRLADAQRAGDGWTLADLRLVLISHMHSDHLVDLPELLLFSPQNGIGSRRPAILMGPGQGGDIERVARRRRFPAIQSPHAPLPGTVEMVERLLDGFATDINCRLPYPGPSELWDVRDIAVPCQGGPIPAASGRSPGIAPFRVYQDESVCVSAALVDHDPMLPAFAFRFDSDFGSVTFSGDTGYSENLIALAHGTDILVHEVLDVEGLARAGTDGGEVPPALRQRLMAIHTTPERVGEVADRAGARALVLSHIIPANAALSRLEAADGTFGRGPVIVGRDLLSIDVASLTATVP